MNEKVCSRCNESKQSSGFYRQSSAPDGLNRWCKLCCDANRKRTDAALKEKDPEAYAAARFARYERWKAKQTPEFLRKKANDFNDKVRRETFAAYGGMFCSCCGETELKFLSIDHINGGGSAHRREINKFGGVNYYQWLRRHNFPPGYRVLCHNCNLGANSNGGICPHVSRQEQSMAA